MATSSITGGEHAATRARGRDVDSLGPSDSSDSGSDTVGERRMPTRPDNPGETGAMPAAGGSDSDAMGTGERASAEGNDERDGRDILPDHVVGGPEGELEAELDALQVDDDQPFDPDAEGEAGELDPDEQ